MVSLAPTRVNCHILGSNHAMYWLYGFPDTEVITGYHATPGTWVYDLVSISNAPNNFSLFLVSTDHVLHQSNFNLLDTADFTPWKKLGGKLSAPPALATRKGAIHIYFIGSDRSLYHSCWDGHAKYTPAEGVFDKLGGCFLHTPTAVSYSPDTSAVFAVGASDACLYQAVWKEGQGHGLGFTKLPGVWVGTPKAVSDQAGCWDIFGINPHGKINHVSFKHGIMNHMVIDGEVQSVEAISWGPGRVDLFALDYRNSTLHKSFDNGNESAWEDLGGILMHVCKGICYGVGSLVVFGIGTDSAMFRNRRDKATGKWLGWKSMGGVCVTRPG